MDRVSQFKTIQDQLNGDRFNNKFTHVIENSYNNLDNVDNNKVNEIKQQIILEVNNLWREISQIQRKTTKSIAFDNVENLYDILASLQLYASLGYIINTEYNNFTKTQGIKILNSFRSNACELFTRKNADYGDAFANYGIVGLIVRMGDKISRINSLSINNVKVVDESIADTFIDLYNYCIMAMMLICDSLSQDTL